jgi:rhodanese-related sulfurtransferase
MTRPELMAALQERQLILVDVLSPESYAVAHIDDAVNLPVADILERASTVLPDRGARIVVYCGGPT